MTKTAMTINETLPDKNFFTPQEVASWLVVKPHVICYWEAEFSDIRPCKNKMGQKLYKREDVFLMSAIKHLLYEKKFTIAGARKIIKNRADNIPYIDSPSEKMDKEELIIKNPDYLKIKETLETSKEVLASVLQSLKRFESVSEWQAWNELEIRN